MSEGEGLPDREKTAFEPKAVVANSGKPRKVNTWARQFMGWCMKAPMEARLAAAMNAGVVKLPTAEERAQFAKVFQHRARYGRKGNSSHWWPWQGGTRGWFSKASTRPDPNHNGDREIERRRSQIARGLISPVYSADQRLERAA